MKWFVSVVAIVATVAAMFLRRRRRKPPSLHAGVVSEAWLADQRRDRE